MMRLDNQKAVTQEKVTHLRLMSHHKHSHGIFSIVCVNSQNTVCGTIIHKSAATNPQKIPLVNH